MQHVVITGASSGLGAALARRYAIAGCRLTLLGRNARRLEETGRACRSVGATSVDQVTCDVTDGAMMRAALIAADDRAPVDLLFANAGLGGRDVLAPTSGETSELARSILEVNMMGVAHTVAPLLERLVARRSGQVVIVSSLAALHGLAEAPAYSASKAAARAYGHGLRRLLARHGVRVTVVLPGFVETPMSASLPYQTPLQVSAEKAAETIARGIARGAREIVFPWQLRLAFGMLAILPVGVTDRILAHSSKAMRVRP